MTQDNTNLCLYLDTQILFCHQHPYRSFKSFTLFQEFIMAPKIPFAVCYGDWQMGYLLSDYLEYDYLQIRCHFDIFTDFPSWVFSYQIWFYYFISCVRGLTETSVIDGVSACSSSTGLCLILSPLYTCFSLPSPFFLDLSPCDRESWAPSTASHARLLF